MKKNKTLLCPILFTCIFVAVGVFSAFKVTKIHNNMTLTTTTLENMQTSVEECSQEIQQQNNTLYKAIKNLNVDLYSAKLCEHNKDESEVQSNRWGITLTEDEIELLARIVMLEAGGESDWGKDAVVEVIFNRMYDEDYPDTLEGVLSESGQFTTWKNRNSKAATPTEEVYDSIYYVLNGYTDIFPFETVYFGRSAQNDNVQLVIENHVFCNK